MKEELKMFLPNRAYGVTQTIVLLNLLVYIWMVVSGVDAIDPSAEDLIVWGGNMDILFAKGEYWRLLTSCFIHIGLIHLLMNMFALLYIGVLLEPVIGHKRFLFAYLVTGIISSLVSAFWNTNQVSAGASGAIFGMYGVFLVLLLSHRIIQSETRKDMLASILIFVGYNLLSGLAGEVDNAAHVGGLLSGLVIGSVYTLSLTKSPLSMKMQVLEAGLPLVLIMLVFSLNYFSKKDKQSFIKEVDMFNQLIDISSRGDEEFKSDMDAPLSLRMEEKNAFKIHTDSCIRILEDYFLTTNEVQPVFHTMYDYFNTWIKYWDMSLEYENSGFNTKYEEELLHLNEKIDSLLNKIDEQYILIWKQ